MHRITDAKVYYIFEQHFEKMTEEEPTSDYSLREPTIVQANTQMSTRF